VKNLDADIFMDDDVLRKTFENYGKITSAILMRDEQKRLRGFGFVCFERAEDATKATIEMNGKMIGSKPLYVALVCLSSSKSDLNMLALFRLSRRRSARSSSSSTRLRHRPLSN